MVFAHMRLRPVIHTTMVIAHLHITSHCDKVSQGVKVSQTVKEPKTELVTQNCCKWLDTFQLQNVNGTGQFHNFDFYYYIDTI